VAGRRPGAAVPGDSLQDDADQLVNRLGVGHPEYLKHIRIPKTAMSRVGDLHHEGRGDPAEPARINAFLDKRGKYLHTDGLMTVVDQACSGVALQVAAEGQAPCSHCGRSGAQIGRDLVGRIGGLRHCLTGALAHVPEHAVDHQLDQLLPARRQPVQRALRDVQPGRNVGDGQAGEAVRQEEALQFVQQAELTLFPFAAGPA
jgi:hypothetical protein